MIKPRREIKIKRFSVDDYYKMIEAGILLENPHEEILDGILFEMPSSTPRKSAITSRLSEIFFTKFDDKDFLVQIYRPVRLNTFNELETDFAFLRKREDLYKNGHPTAKDVFLLMEISDESLEFDKTRKLPLYAEAEIQEVWIINLQSNIVELHQRPSNGLYQFVKIFNRGEAVQSEVLPNLTLSVDEILG